MRIGIDGHVLGKDIGGVERFVGELVARLPAVAPAHEYVVFVTRRAFAARAGTADARVRFVPYAFAGPLLQRLVLLPWLARRHRLDVLVVQRLAPWFCGRCRLVVTVHDLIPIKFAAVYRGLSNRLVRLLTRDTLRRAALILTPTETIRGELQRYAGPGLAPVCAFYNGVDTGRFNADRATTDAALLPEAPFLLTVGALEPRKNVETIFAALALLADHPTLRLGIVGATRDTAYRAALADSARAHGVAERVHYLGFVAEADLVTGYRRAVAFVTASLDEGFNIPPLEAMACGAVVLCSDIPVHRELFDGAALFFATRDAAELATKLRTLLEPSAGDARATLLAAGRRKAEAFTWDAMARRVAGALEALAAHRG